jgi:lipoic acid synthetase
VPVDASRESLALPILAAPPAAPACGPVAPPASRRLPPWLRQNLGPGGGHAETAHLIAELGLETVGSSAKCPNRLECWSARTATFMILGNVCTRPCGFCSVPKGKTEDLEQDEPERVAEAARRLGLQHVVITSVTRDDLPDGGAEHFCQTVAAVRRACGATVEVLPSDLGGNRDALDRLIEAAPDVYNHNVETVPRLFRDVRGPKPDYRWTLEMFRRIKRANGTISNGPIRTKTGMMLGLGETCEEVLDTLADLSDAGCEFVTLGQYLQPSPAQTPVARYLPPEEFDALGRAAERLGFAQVAAGPLVRSSYHAREMVGEKRKAESGKRQMEG